MHITYPKNVKYCVMIFLPHHPPPRLNWKKPRDNVGLNLQLKLPGNQFCLPDTSFVTVPHVYPCNKSRVPVFLPGLSSCPFSNDCSVLHFITFSLQPNTESSTNASLHISYPSVKLCTVRYVKDFSRSGTRGLSDRVFIKPYLSFCILGSGEQLLKLLMHGVFMLLPELLLKLRHGTVESTSTQFYTQTEPKVKGTNIRMRIYEHSVLGVGITFTFKPEVCQHRYQHPPFT